MTLGLAVCILLLMIGGRAALAVLGWITLAAILMQALPAV